MFPVAGFFVAASLGSWTWAWAEAAALPPWDWRTAFRAPYSLILLASALVPVAWAAGMFFESRVIKGRRVACAAIATLLALATIDTAFRIPVVRQPFLFGVWKRTTSWFMRDVLPLLTHVPSPDGFRGKPVVTFAGSSQLVFGIDYDVVRSALPDAEVRRRAIAGMFPMRIYSVWPLLDVGKGDTLVLYLSDFDMMWPEGVVGNWHRSMATWRGSMNLCSTLSGKQIVEDWRDVTDVFAASTSSLWSQRDNVRELCFGYFARWGNTDRLAAQPPTVLDESPAASARYYDAHKLALTRMLELASEAGARVIIIEGRVNPAYESEKDVARRTMVAEDLSRISSDKGAEFIARSEQDWEDPLNDWADSVHLNERGKERLSRFVAGLLQKRVPRGPSSGGEG